MWFLPLALACSKPSGDIARERASSAAPSARANFAPSEPGRRHSLDFSAYAATLWAEGDDLYVLTSHEVLRLAPTKPPERFQIELGDTPAITRSGIVYWLGGELRRAPKQGGSSEVLASLPKRPRRLGASGDRVVWEEADGDGVTLRTLAGSEPRAIFQGPGSIEALTLMDDQVYFIHRAAEGWRLGNVALEGGPPRYREPRASRTPAQLAAAGEVFFYDGPTSTLRRVTSDLSREDVVARDVICSPLAVGARVYCAQVSLLFGLDRDGSEPRLLAPKRPGTITSLVTTRTRVAWLLETGEESALLEVIEQ